MKGKRSVYLRYIALLSIFFYNCGRKEPPPGKPDIDGPVVSILTPLESDTVRDSLLVSASAEDKSGILYLVLVVDGVESIRDSSPPFEFLLDTHILLDTLHTLMVKGIDTWDNWGESKKITIYVKNEEEKTDESD